MGSARLPSCCFLWTLHSGVHAHEAQLRCQGARGRQRVSKTRAWGVDGPAQCPVPVSGSLVLTQGGWKGRDKDAEKHEIRAQEVKGAPAVPVRAVDIRPRLRRLQFRVKLQCWHLSQETVLKVSHRTWATVTGLGVEAAQLSRHGKV